MNLSSLATSALATTRSTFKGLAEAAVASGDNADTAGARARSVERPAPAKPAAEPAGRADSEAAKPRGVRRGTLLDAYA